MRDTLHTYRMLLAYDGTHYHGWQVQPNATTIQEVIQTEMAKILRSRITLVASGRTDAGVHAVGQVAHFHFPEEIDLYKLHGALNSLLPRDIRILSIEKAHDGFHAQYSPTGKTYHYHLYLDRVMDPFRRLYCLHVRERIELDVLRQCAQVFVGTHDFTSFANEAHAGSASRDPVRTLRRLDVVDQTGGVRLEFEADGFLYKMVRNIVGTLLEAASGKICEFDIKRILEAKDRRLAGKAAPPHGLFLVNVDYPTTS